MAYVDQTLFIDHLYTKLRVILNSYLGETIDTANAALEPDADARWYIKKPRQQNIIIGTSILSAEGIKNYLDLGPAISVSISSDQTLGYDITNARDVLIELKVRAFEKFDSVTPEWTDLRSQRLRDCVSKTLEMRLADLPGQDDSTNYSIYRVDIDKTNVNATQSIGNNFYIVTSESNLKIWARVSYTWEPAFVDTQKVRFRPYTNVYTPTSASLDLTYFDTGTMASGSNNFVLAQNAITTIPVSGTWTPFGTMTINVDPNIPDGSRVVFSSTALQNGINSSVSGSMAELNTTDTNGAIVDNQFVNIIVQNSTKGTPSFYTIKWDV